MNKIFCLLLIVCMVFCFCSCKEDAYVEVNGEPLSSEPVASSKENISSEVVSEVSSEATTESSSKSETPSQQTTPEETSSVSTSSNTASTPSEPTESAVSTPVSEPTQTTETPVTTQTQVLGRTVLDPDNTRALSTERNGYSYGVAKDGQPNITSVNNQDFFDSLSNVEALTLDRKSSEKCMYLTFDCGYEYEGITGEMLDILKEKNVKAAFFCTLDYFKKNYDLVRRMIDEGHIVGNHSATHPDFSAISRTKMAEEIYTVEDYLKTTFNYSSPYFRFPSGAHSVSALDLVTSLGYKSIFWSVAHKDWETANQPTAETAFNTVTSRYHSGAVILLHSVSSANRDALAQMIDKAHADGYVFKTLDDYYG